MVWIVLGSIVGVLVVAGVIAYAMGSALPVGHTATVSKTVDAAPSEVWKVITDIDAMPSWRKDLKSVERTEGKDSLPRWIEKSGFGDIPFQAEEMAEPHRLVTRIDDPKLPFGGKWTYILEPKGGQTEVTITEEGEVRSPVFRFMSKYIFGHTKTLETYLEQLDKRLGG